MTDFQFYQLIITFIFSIVAAGFTYAQWSINKSKLRLDLYNRRFDVYLKMLDYYFSYTNKKKDNDYEYIDECRIAFIKVYRESLFLFGEESDVYKKLNYFQQNLGQLVNIDKKLDTLTNDSDREYLSDKRYELYTSVFVSDFLAELEQSLKKWLDFHEVN